MRAKISSKRVTLAVGVVLLFVISAVLPSAVQALGSAGSAPIAPPSKPVPTVASFLANYSATKNALAHTLSAYPALTASPRSAAEFESVFNATMSGATAVDRWVNWQAAYAYYDSIRGGVSSKAEAWALLNASGLMPAQGSGLQIVATILLFAAIGCVIGFAVGGPIGCLVGALVAAFLVGIAILLSFFNQNNFQRTSAALQARTMLGAMADVLELNTNSTRNELNALNLTAIALSYQTASLALTQLPNATFNIPLDLLQSGLIPQLVTVLNADAIDIAGIIANGVNQFGAVFGATGYYGAQGIVCQLLVGGGGSTYYSYYPLASPDAHGGYSATNGNDCLSETGTPQIASWVGSAGGGLLVQPPTTTGQAAGEYYLTANSPIEVATITGNPPQSVGYGYPYVLLQFQPIAGTGGTWLNESVPVASNGQPTWNFTGTTGVYFLSALDCQTATTNPASCFAQSFTTTGVAFLQLSGAFPLNSATRSVSELSGWYVADDQYNAKNDYLLFVCGTNLSGAEAYDLGTTVQFNLANQGWQTPQVGTCGSSDGYLLTELTNLEVGAGNVADAYWTFLRAQGYTNVNQVPAKCVVPDITNALPPTMTAQQLAQLGIVNLTRLYYAYLLQLGFTFNSSYALNSGTFCGKHLNTNGFGSIFGAPLPVNATGDIFVPNAGASLVTAAAITETNSSGQQTSGTTISKTISVTKYQTVVVDGVTNGASGTVSQTGTSEGAFGHAAHVEMDGAGAWSDVWVQNITATGSETVTVNAPSAALMIEVYVLTGAKGTWTTLATSSLATTPTTESWTASPSSFALVFLTPQLSAGGIGVTYPAGWHNASYVGTQGETAIATGIDTMLGSGAGSALLSWTPSKTASIAVVAFPTGGRALVTQNIATPSTWNITGVEFMLIPSAASIVVGMNAVWELPFANPSEILVAGNAQNQSIAFFGGAPIGFLFRQIGNSTVLTGSPYPVLTNHSLDAVGTAVYVQTCAVQNPNGKYTNYTSVCPFNKTVINFWWTNFTCLILGQCSGPAAPSLLSSACAGTAGLTAWYDSWVGGIVNAIGGGLAGVPVLGLVSCGIGWLIALVGVIVVILLVAWGIVSVYRIVRGRPRPMEED